MEGSSGAQTISPALLFLIEHGRLHAAAVGGDEQSYQDGLLKGLTDDQLRARPGGLNSIAFLLWHATRFEDVVVNRLLRGGPEILTSGEWAGRLGVETRHLGTGMSDDDATGFGDRVDVAGLLAYRAAVGRETRAWVETGGLDGIPERPDIAARMADAADEVRGAESWMPALWSSMSGLELLLVPVLTHGFVHIGEARVTRSRLVGPGR